MKSHAIIFPILLFAISACKSISQSSDLNQTKGPVGLCGDNFCLTVSVRTPKAYTFAVQPLSEKNDHTVVTAIKYLHTQGDQDPDTSAYKHYRIYRLDYNYGTSSEVFFKNLMTDVLKLESITKNDRIHDELQRLVNDKKIGSYFMGYERYSFFRGTLQVLINALAELHNNKMKARSQQVVAVDLADFANGRWRTWGKESLLYPKTE